MRSSKTFSMTVILVLSVFGTANASAAIFTATQTGTLTGHALEPRKFTVNGGTIECNSVSLSGTIEKTSQEEQHVTLQYSECKAFGIANVDISNATLLATANGTVHMLNQFVMTVTKSLFSGECTITYPEQTLETFDFATIWTHFPKTETHETTTVSDGIKSTPTVTGMEYTSSGGVCGASGGNGTLSGAIQVEMEGEGSLQFDP